MSSHPKRNYHYGNSIMKLFANDILILLLVGAHYFSLWSPTQGISITYDSLDWFLDDNKLLTLNLVLTYATHHRMTPDNDTQSCHLSGRPSLNKTYCSLESRLIRGWFESHKTNSGISFQQEFTP